MIEGIVDIGTDLYGPKTWVAENRVRLSRSAKSAICGSQIRDLGLASWLRQGLVVIFKNAQSMAFSRHLEEPLIFQRKLKKKVARSNRNEQGKKENGRRNGTHSPECR